MPKIGPKLRKVMRRHGVKTVFSSGSNLQDILCNHKSKFPSGSYPGVYKIQCECNVVYIGETKKRVKTRITEHERDVFHGRWSNSGATEHAESCMQNFKWNETATLKIESNYRRRKIRESLEIRRHRRSQETEVNRDQGKILKSQQWDVLMGKIKPGLQ